MSLYALGDLHLSFQSDKDMSVFGKEWEGHVEKIKNNWISTVTEEDTIVVTGDVSWGKNFECAIKDLEFVAELPGRKILLRGNHCLYWKKNKTEELQKYFGDRLLFLHCNHFVYEDYAIVGGKGFSAEFEDEFAQAEKRYRIEMRRVEESYDSAKKAGFEKYLLFLHYPPTDFGESDGRFRQFAERIGAEQVIYSHLHGKAKFDGSIKGMLNGINYTLVSGDYVDFVPQKIK